MKFVKLSGAWNQIKRDDSSVCETRLKINNNRYWDKTIQTMLKAHMISSNFGKWYSSTIYFYFIRVLNIWKLDLPHRRWKNLLTNNVNSHACVKILPILVRRIWKQQDKFLRLSGSWRVLFINDSAALNTIKINSNQLNIFQHFFIHNFTYFLRFNCKAVVVNIFIITVQFWTFWT